MMIVASLRLQIFRITRKIKVVSQKLSFKHDKLYCTCKRN